MNENVQFQNEDILDATSIQNRLSDKTPGMAKMLMNWGLAKNAQQAQMYLLGVVVAVVAISIFVVLSAMDSPDVVPVDALGVPPQGMPGGAYPPQGGMRPPNQGGYR